MDGDMIKHERWMNRKQIPFAAFSYEDQCHESWEERAFAEDAARGIGGFIWPPRSYACSFCRREFKSAQALGGHMNVHRRDRARLKQALTTTTTAPTSAQTAHAEPKMTEENKGRVSTKLCMELSLDEFNKCKRLKSTGNFIFAEKQCLMVQPSSSVLLRRHQGGLANHSQMSFREELDLELRLGV